MEGESRILEGAFVGPGLLLEDGIVGAREGAFVIGGSDATGLLEEATVGALVDGGLDTEGLEEVTSAGAAVGRGFGIEVGLGFKGRRVVRGLIVGGGVKLGWPVGGGSGQLQTTL